MSLILTNTADVVTITIGIGAVVGGIHAVIMRRAKKFVGEQVDKLAVAIRMESKARDNRLANRMLKIEREMRTLESAVDNGNATSTIGNKTTRKQIRRPIPPNKN